MVFIERSAACSPPPPAKDPVVDHDQAVRKTLAGPRLINRPILLKPLYHHCASSLPLWQQYWRPDLSSAKQVSSEISLVINLFQ